MRVLILYIFLLHNLISYSQDTLILNNGQTHPVKILAINKDQGLIKYKYGQDTIIRTLTSLSSYKLNSSDIDIVIIQPSPSTKSDPVNKKFRRENRKNNFLSQASSYQYSGISIGINSLSFLSASQILENQVASNTHLSFYIEYKYKERYGIRLASRIGLLNADLEETWDPSKGRWKNHNTNHLLFELGLEPTFYLNRHNKISTYVKTGFYLGKNYGLDEIYYEDYYSYPNPAFDSSIYYSHRQNSIGDLRWYYRASLSMGIEINLLKHLSFGLEAGAYFGNNIHGHWTTFYNTHQSEEYIWQEEGFYSSPFNYSPLQFQGSLSLIYRIGGRDRSLSDKS